MKAIVNIIAVLLFIGIFSCQTKSKKDNIILIDSSSFRTNELNSKNEFEHETSSTKTLDSAKVEIDLTDTSEFFLFNTKCAISILPDTSWLQEYQKSMPEEAYIEVISDYQYYNGLAIDTLEIKGIPVFYSLNWRKRYIKFKTANDSSFIIDFAKMKDSWGIILFNGIEPPVIWFDTFIGSTINDIYH